MPLICGTLGELYGWHWGFGAAGVGMLAGLTIYVLGGKYLPDQGRVEKSTLAMAAATPAGNYRMTFILLFAVIISVTVFRSAYEQVGNTVALWADVGIDRVTAVMTIPMTWFQSLNPLLVILMTPMLLAHWRRRARAGSTGSSMRKMALGALIVAAAYLLLAVVAFSAGEGRASWLWLALFFAVFTLGELYILPTGLGLFARLAPAGFGATTVAAWFCTMFTGNFLAGAVGTLWAGRGHAQFFAILTLISGFAAAMLFALDRAARRIEAERAAEIITTSNALQPELLA